MKKRTKKNLLLCLFYLCLVALQAQNYTVSGTIKGEDGEGLVGVVIESEDQKYRDITDFDGFFTLTLPEGQVTLKIQYPGIYGQEFIVEKESKLSIIAREDPCDPYSAVILLSYQYVPDPFLRRERGDWGRIARLEQADEIHFSRENKYEESDLLTSINESPGISIIRNGLNTSSINMRGMSNQKVSIGDIPMYLGRSSNLIEDINVTTLGRYKEMKSPEITAGMQQGGHLDFSTKRASSAISSSIHRGDNNFFNINNSLRLRQEYKGCYVGELSINHNLIKSEGERDHSNYEKQSLSINGIQMGPGPEKQWNLFIHIASVERDLAGPLSLEELKTDPSIANPEWSEVGARDQHETGMASISRKFDLDKARKNGNIENKSSLFAIWNNQERVDPERYLDNRTLVWGGKSQFNIKKRLKSQNTVNLTAGVEYYDETIDWEIYDPLDVGKVEQINGNQERRSYLDVFMGGDFYFAYNLRLTGGLNINRSVVESTDKFSADGIDYNKRENFGFVVSPQFSGFYQITDRDYGPTLFGKAGHGLSRIPTGSISFPETAVRYLHEPERAWNFELGVNGDANNTSYRGQKVRFHYAASVYFISRKNMLSVDDFLVFNNNIEGRANHSGLEVLVKVLMKNSHWYTAYNYRSDRFIDFQENSIDYSDQVIPGNAMHTVNTGLVLKSGHRGFYFRMNYEYRSPMQLNNANTLQSDAYQLVHTKLGFRYVPSSTKARYGRNYGNKKLTFDDHMAIARSALSFDFYLGINNALDTEYLSDFVSARDFPIDNGSGAYYPGTARFLYAGVKVSINRNPYLKQRNVTKNLIEVTEEEL